MAVISTQGIDDHRNSIEAVAKHETLPELKKIF